MKNGSYNYIVKVLMFQCYSYHFHDCVFSEMFFSFAVYDSSFFCDYIFLLFKIGETFFHTNLLQFHSSCG